MKAPLAPAESHVSRVVLSVGGRRFRLTHRIESEEIQPKPAEVIEMPARSAHTPEEPDSKGGAR